MKVTTTATTEIINDSKTEESMIESDEHTNFINTIHSLLNKLMHKYGYSRERATKAMLQELNRSVYPSAIVITEKEVRSNESSSIPEETKRCPMTWMTSGFPEYHIARF